MLQVEVNKTHVKTILLHVDVNKTHVNIITLHVDIITLHVDIIHFACMGQTYATILWLNQ